jgi:hypothetical protein
MTLQQAGIQGDLTDALKSFQDGLVVFKHLAQKDSGNAEWQRDLSVSYEKVGDVQMAQGDLKAALKSYSDGLKNIVTVYLAARLALDGSYKMQFLEKTASVDREGDCLPPLGPPPQAPCRYCSTRDRA